MRAYIVWVPMSRGMERDVPTATKEVWDPRARHYWDGEGQLIASYRDVLGGFDEPVWDTFVLYGKDAQWDRRRPPAPGLLDAPARRRRSGRGSRGRSGIPRLPGTREDARSVVGSRQLAVRKPTADW